jgi:hypothetical protein
MIICKTCGSCFEPPIPNTGHPKHCMSCRRSGENKRRNTKLYRLAHKEACRAATKAWYNLNRSHCKQTQAAWHRSKKYGLSEAAYSSMLASQDGRCAICRRLPTSGRVLYIDHNHSTGVVRALLCQACNFVVGAAETSGVPLREAEAYILTHSTSSK